MYADDLVILESDWDRLRRTLQIIKKVFEPTAETKIDSLGLRMLVMKMTIRETRLISVADLFFTVT